MRIIDWIDDDKGLHVASGALLVLSLIPITLGSFSSVRTLKYPTPRRRRRSSSSSIDDDDDDDLKTQTLNIQDAFMFPIVGSVCVLFAYLTVKNVGNDKVHQLGTLFTTLLSTSVFSSTLLSFARHSLPRSFFGRHEQIKFTISKSGHKLFRVTLTVIHLIILAVSLALAVTFGITKHWTVSNIFAICIAINAIKFIKIDSFKTGFVLLMGMLIYDLIWIFGTDMMLTISKALADSPTRIVWPRNVQTYFMDSLLKDHYFTLFGLGDIIIPGVFVAYCLIYDKQSAWKDARKNDEFATLSYSKPYFYSALFAYAVGAGLSLVCVHVYRRPQSALLFISPALILSVIAVSFAKGELDQVIDFINFGAVTGPLRPPQPVLRKSPRRRSVSKEKATGARNRSVSKEKPSRRGSIKQLAEPEINFDEDDMTSSKDTTIAEDVIANHAAKGTRRTRASTRKE